MNCPACRSENRDDAAACAACGATLVPAPTRGIVVTVDLSPGVVFHSRYEILGPLGHGGMGMVYRARDRSLDEIVAIKILRPDFAQDPRMAQRFKSEIRLARKVRHRNVCTIHDFGEEQGLVFISMEFVDGVDLKRALGRAKGGLPTEQAYDIVIQIADGLEAVHEAGIIHRDLKTPNVMLDSRGNARLMDFGLAKQEHSQGDSATATGHVVGTPEYMSPEQAQGTKLDARCDIYALGVVAFEVFSGRVPFRGDTPISTILKHLHDAPPLEGPEATGIPVEILPILKKALAKEPPERYGSAREMSEALRKARARRKGGAAVDTGVVEAQTLTAVQPVTPPPTRPAPIVRKAAPRTRAAPKRSAMLQPWLLAIPLVAVGAGVFLVQRNSPPPSIPAATLAAAPASAAPSATPPTPTPEPVAATTPVPSAPATLSPAAKPRPSAAAPTPRPAPPTTSTLPIAAATPAPAPAPSRAPETPAPRPTEAPETGTGLLRVVVRPWANVIVDGRPMGTTPLDRIELAAGTRTVRLEHPLYEPFETKVRVRAGETARLDVDFAKEGVRKPQ